MENIVGKIFKKIKTKKIGAIRRLIARKNIQIRAEREKYQAERAANSILTAYILYLASQTGVIRIPRAEVSAALGKYSVTAYSEGDDYVIELKAADHDGEGELCGKAGNLQGMV